MVAQRDNPRARSGILVAIIDTDEAAAEARKFFFEQDEEAKNWPEEKKKRVVAEPSPITALAFTERGVFRVNTEGVMSRDPITRLDIAFYARIEAGETEDDLGAVGLTPFCSVGFEVDKVKLKEVVRLEDFIKRFGARLESNYEICRSHLQASGPLPPPPSGQQVNTPSPAPGKRSAGRRPR